MVWERSSWKKNFRTLHILTRSVMIQKKKELRIVEDEDTAGGILSYEELAAMENENASVRNNMLPDTDQLAFVDEAEKKR